MKNHWLTQHQTKMDPLLRRILLKTFQSTEENRSLAIPVIIQLKDRLCVESVDQCKKIADSSSFKVRYHLPIINAISGNTSSEGLRKLCESAVVHQIHLNRKYSTNLHVASPSVGSRLLYSQKGLSGKGIGIAIIDTGIYPHPDLSARYIGFKDFVNQKTRPYDDNGHGTHVAGCAVGNGAASKGRYMGSAPGAFVVGVKVLDKNGSGLTDAVIAGIQWCLTNRKRLNIRILNLSFGSPLYTSYKKDLLCQAVDKAVRAGMIVVTAAGNTGPNASTITTPGISPLAITVGALDDRRTVKQNDDTIAPFSARGPTRDGLVKPDVMAPGVGIVSPASPGSVLDLKRQGSVGKWYGTLSGTSFATPIVAGAIAQMLQRNPYLTPGQVKEILKKGAFPVTGTLHSRGSGALNMRFLLSTANVRKAKRATRGKRNA